MKPLLRRLLLWAALPVLLMALAVWSWTPREPSWDGRSLGEWLKDLEPDKSVTLGADGALKAEAARRAIQGMGTNCLPFLLQRLGHLEPTPLESMIIKLEEQLGKHSITIPWARMETGQPTLAYALRSAFSELGHQAAPAVPELQQWLLTTNATKAWSASYVLTVIHPEGTAALIAAVTNRAIPDRMIVLFALHGIDSKHPEALAAFLGRAEDPDPSVRSMVGSLISIRRQDAAVILTVLLRLLDDPVGEVRASVLQRLGRIEWGIATQAPALTPLAADTDPEISSKANALLLKIKAQSATPLPAP